MRHLSLLLSALLFSAFAQAASSANVATISCSGSQSFDLANGAMLSCDGDFSLIGGSIDSDTGITISAVGSLFLDDLKLSAPLVQLTTVSGVLSVTEGVTINTLNWTNFDISASDRTTLTQPADRTLLEGRIGTINAGGNISLGQPGQITLRNDAGIVVRQPGDIDLNAGGQIALNGGDQIVLNGGGNLALVSSVPEPAAVWSLLCGGLLLAIRRKNPA